MPSRLEMLTAFVAKNPADPFARYGLAMEYKNGGQLDQAWRTFEELMGAMPDYVPAYLHAGNTLVALGRAEEAREIYRRGIDAASRKGDGHSRGELEGALQALG